MKPSNHFQTIASIVNKVRAPFQPKKDPRDELADEIEVRLANRCSAMPHNRQRDGMCLKLFVVDTLLKSVFSFL
jgi:hypothetical protein